MKGIAGSIYAGNPDWVMVLKIIATCLQQGGQGPHLLPPRPAASLLSTAQSSPTGAPREVPFSLNNFVEHLEFSIGQALQIQT